MEPEWEAQFEPNSYGFRPGRSAHDAIGAIYMAINKQPKYVLDADIAKCFDRIDRDALLRKTGTFPTLQRLIKHWLNAGIVDNGVFSKTDRGTQQGSLWLGKEVILLPPPPGSQARLLPPSPLRTARTGFPISSSSLSNARCRTRLVHGYTQVVNFAMAFGM